MLALPAPPKASTDDSDRYINSSRNHEIEDILGQPTEKRSVVKKGNFIKEKQKSIDHVVNFIANFVVFARYWIKMTDETTTQPTIVQILIEVIDYISSSDYKTFNEKHITAKAYMPHTLIAYLSRIYLTSFLFS